MATERTGIYGTYYGSTKNESEYLTTTEMQHNADYIFSHFINQGWTINAVAALLGNMEVESTFNPGIWQSHEIGNYEGGYGLVQWTPATKYTDWCAEQGYSDFSTMDNNLSRIDYEVANGIQWISKDEYSNMTFKEFSTSTESVDYLTKAFMQSYERPKDQSESALNARGEKGVSWFNYLGSVTPINPGGTTKPKRKKFNFLLFNRRRGLQWQGQKTRYRL